MVNSLLRTLQRKRIHKVQHVGHLPHEHNRADTTHRACYFERQTGDVITTDRCNLHGVGMLVRVDVGADVLADEFLRGLVAERYDRLQEIYELGAVILLLEEEVKTLWCLLDLRAVHVRVVSQNHLFQPVESALVLDLLTDLRD